MGFTNPLTRWVAGLGECTEGLLPLVMSSLHVATLIPSLIRDDSRKWNLAFPYTKYARMTFLGRYLWVMFHSLFIKLTCIPSERKHERNNYHSTVDGDVLFTNITLVIFDWMYSIVLGTNIYDCIYYCGRESPTILIKSGLCVWLSHQRWIALDCKVFWTLPYLQSLIWFMCMIRW